MTVSGVPAQISRAGSQVIVNYTGASKCADFKINIAKGLESNHAIAQTEPQTFSSRTVCHTVQTVGYSKDGRAINAYFFGNGGKTILFTGAIHGSEKSSKYIMDSWINDLEAQAKSIPADKQVVVVPLVNPDGFYQYGRYNGNNVNLNRNWPTPNWVKDDATQAGVGGSAPLSEPESQVLARLTQNLNPAFVATFHSQGRLVNSNDAGSSITLGQRYASMVRYRFIPDAQTEAVLGGTVTGTYEDWLKSRGTPAILMELDGHTANYFTAHKRALWMLISDY